MTANTSTQLEYLTPADIDAALEHRSLMFLPLGTIEWHGQHLPVGFDAISAHTICTSVAARTGGLVYPALYYGLGGGHGDFAWTVMSNEATLGPLLDTTISRLADFGVEHIALVTGHFPHEQLEFLDRTARRAGHLARVDVYSPISPGADLPIEGDHAGLFETSLMQGLNPEHVHLDRLPTRDGALDGARELPASALYGVGGPDPRNVDTEQANHLTETLINWITSRIDT